MKLSSLILCIFLLTAQQPSKVYEVQHVTADFEITGRGDHATWDKSGLLTDFTLPWNQELAQPTSFRALWSDQYYYFLYHVVDLDIVAPSEARDEVNVLPSDRIEIFFKVNDAMDPYYCLEMDSKGRVLDYEGRFYRNSNFEWDWPAEEIDVKAQLTPDGYSVEGKISLKSLRELGIINPDESLSAGLFRGDYFHVNAGKTSVRWISWVIPDSSKPDFHIPSAFGKLALVK